MSQTNRPPALCNRLKKAIVQIIVLSDKAGGYILGPWWRPITLAIQDAIGIGFMFWVPARVLTFVSLGEEFSGLAYCWREIDKSEPSFVACLAIVSADYCFWLLYLARTIVRFGRQLRGL